MLKKRKPAFKFPVQYNEPGVSINYVSRATPEVWPELRRVRAAINDVIRILTTLKRIRNGVLVSTRFILLNCHRDLPDDTPLEIVAAEIGRLSYIMADALETLNTLKYCRIHHLEEARFKLTYGQTPKKRDPTGDYRINIKHDRQSFDSDRDDSGEDSADAEGDSD